MLNIVIPMAGRGSRFAQVGYKLPKPLIEIHGHPMIEYVVKNIKPKQENRFIFICLKEHLEKYDLAKKLELLAPGCVVVTVEEVTDGAACTVLLAEQYIDNENPLMIANSDQYIDMDVNEYLLAIQGYDGGIMTMPANDPKWSFIRYDENCLVTEVREKEVISNEATVGIYNYRTGSDFVHFAHQMIKKNIRVNNEFYVAPVYNEMIAAGRKLTFFNVGSGMYGLGVPEDLNTFEQTPLSMKVLCEET